MLPKWVGKTIHLLLVVVCSVLFSPLGLFVVANLPVGVGWPWTVVGLTVGAAIGAVFAVGLTSIFRAVVGNLRRPRLVGRA